MGSRLSAASFMGALLLAGHALAQPGPLPASDLAKQGIEKLNTGDYAGAVALLERAHEMEPNNFEYRFSLAQALRGAGNCDAAVPHYKALIDTAPDPNAANDVRVAMQQCPDAEASAQPPPPPPPAPAPAPQIVVRGGIGTSDVLLVGGSGAALGAAVVLFMAARADGSDADAAASYSDYERISSRSDRLYLGSAIAAGAAVALGAVAFYRIKVSKESSTSIAITPRADGGAVVLGGAW